MREIDDDLELVVGGSYRRGQTDSGDIDILITKKSAGKELIRTIVLDVIVPKLMNSGLLKASLATGRSDEETSKWHGASALPNSAIWRRLDLLFVRGDEIGAGFDFTGPANDIFNRSIRLPRRSKRHALESARAPQACNEGQGSGEGHRRRIDRE